MEGMLFYRIKDVKARKLQYVSERQAERIEKAESVEKPRRIQNKVVVMPNLGNVFLDDDLLSEVRICQAM